MKLLALTIYSYTFYISFLSSICEATNGKLLSIKIKDGIVTYILASNPDNASRLAQRLGNPQACDRFMRINNTDINTVKVAVDGTDEPELRGQLQSVLNEPPNTDTDIYVTPSQLGLECRQPEKGQIGLDCRQPEKGQKACGKQIGSIHEPVNFNFGQDGTFVRNVTCRQSQAITEEELNQSGSVEAGEMVDQSQIPCGNRTSKFNRLGNVTGFR